MVQWKKFISLTVSLSLLAGCALVPTATVSRNKTAAIGASDLKARVRADHYQAPTPTFAVQVDGSQAFLDPTIGATAAQSIEADLTSEAKTSLASKGTDSTVGEWIALPIVDAAGNFQRWSYGQPWGGLGAATYAVARRVLDFLLPPPSGAELPTSAWTVISDQQHPGELEVVCPPGNGRTGFLCHTLGRYGDEDFSGGVVSWNSGFSKTGSSPVVTANAAQRFNVFGPAQVVYTNNSLPSNGEGLRQADWSYYGSPSSDRTIYIWTETTGTGSAIGVPGTPYFDFVFANNVLVASVPYIAPNVAGFSGALSAVPGGDSLMLSPPGSAPHVPTGSNFRNTPPPAGTPIRYTQLDGHLGAPTTGSPPPVPTPTPDPSPTPNLGLSDQYAAFSPNGDGVKDRDALAIAAGASQNWTLSIDGQGTIQAGVGSATINWDGKINGTTLPDGQYVVRAHSDGGLDQTLQVIIDTQSPQVSNIRLTNDDSDPLGYKYFLAAHIADVGLAGFNRDTLNVEVVGEAASSTNISLDTSDMLAYHAFIPDIQLASSSGTSGYKILTATTETVATDAVKISGSDFAGNMMVVYVPIPHHCPGKPLTPITDPVALNFENGQTIDVDDLVPNMKIALSSFKNSVENHHGVFILTSAYRPPVYQQHLRDVYDKWKQI